MSLEFLSLGHNTKLAVLDTIQSLLDFVIVDENQTLTGVCCQT